ncbi:unnamed protein product [Diamesa serratosioi]
MSISQIVNSTKLEEYILRSPVNVVEIKENIIKFLKEKNLLKDLEKNCVYFHQKSINNQATAFITNLQLNYNDIPKELVFLITKETCWFEVLLKEIILSLVKSIFQHLNLTVDISLKQLYCGIRFFDLPNIPEYTFNIQSCHTNVALTTFRCIIYSTSPSEKYTRLSSWYCPLKCDKNIIASKVFSVPKCWNCSADCIEHINQRVVSTVSTAQVFEVNSHKAYRNQSTLQSTLTIKLFDDLCQDLRLGHEYTIIMSQNCGFGMTLSPEDLFKANGCELNNLTATQDIFSTQNEDLTSIHSVVSNYTQVASYFSPPKNQTTNSHFFQNSQRFQDSQNSQCLSQNEDTFQSQVEQELNFLQQNSEIILDDIPNIDKSFSQDYLRSQHDESQNFEFTQPEIRTTSSINGNNYHSHEDLFESCKSLHSTVPSTIISVNEFIELDNLPIPQSIINMYMTIRKNYSDWVFVYALTAQLCSDFFPTGTYFNLKQSLLLSIASIDGSAPPLQIIALGRNTSDANIVMNLIGKLAERFLTSVSTFNGALINKTVTEAGPLLMAKNGVFYVGDWARLPTKNVTSLLRDIETGKVIIDKSQQMPYSLDCAVWSYWGCNTVPKKDLTTLNQFMSVFGIPIILDDVHNEEYLIDDLLNQASTNPSPRFKEVHIPDDDMRTYLAYISRRKVTMEPRAEKMLREYFVATRIARPNALTQKAFEVLKQMAESHAKLCFRSIVSRQDILATIEISEKFIRAFFEKDNFSSPPEMPYEAFEDVEKYQHQLYQWFSCFSKDTLENQFF